MQVPHTCSTGTLVSGEFKPMSAAELYNFKIGNNFKSIIVKR